MRLKGKIVLVTAAGPGIGADDLPEAIVKRPGTEAVRHDRAAIVGDPLELGGDCDPTGNDKPALVRPAVSAAVEDRPDPLEQLAVGDAAVGQTGLLDGRRP